MMSKAKAKRLLAAKRGRGRPSKKMSKKLKIARKVLGKKGKAKKAKKHHKVAKAKKAKAAKVGPMSKAAAKRLLARKWGRGRPSKARVAKLRKARKVLGK